MTTTTLRGVPPEFPEDERHRLRRHNGSRWRGHALRSYIWGTRSAHAPGSQNSGAPSGHEAARQSSEFDNNTSNRSSQQLAWPSLGDFRLKSTTLACQARSKNLSVSRAAVQGSRPLLHCGCLTHIACTQNNSDAVTWCRPHDPAPPNNVPRARMSTDALCFGTSLCARSQKESTIRSPTAALVDQTPLRASATRIRITVAAARSWARGARAHAPPPALAAQSTVYNATTPTAAWALRSRPHGANPNRVRRNRVSNRISKKSLARVAEATGH